MVLYFDLQHGDVVKITSVKFCVNPEITRSPFSVWCSLLSSSPTLCSAGTGQRTLWNSVYLSLCSEWEGGMVSYTGPLSASDIIGNCGLLSVQVRVNMISLSPTTSTPYFSMFSLGLVTFPPLFPLNFSSLLSLSIVTKYDYLGLLLCVVVMLSFSRCPSP